MIFPPSFLDSSSWNDNQQHAHQLHQVTASGCGGDGGGNHELAVQVHPSVMQQGELPEGGNGGGGGGGGGQVGPVKPMSMSERARMARVPLPEQGLKCPRCDSGNTKFCYFNNYSLSQPRHFCRACRRYWTRGGALRNVPVGGGYRRHAKRAKPKQSATAAATAGAAPAAPSAAAGGGSSTTSSGCTTTTANAPPALPPGMLSGNLSGLLPPLLRLSDFDAMSLGSNFSALGKLSSVDVAAGCYSVGGGAAATGLEQWRLQQMQGFPFFHAIDQQTAALPPAPAMTMPMPAGMFHYLGVDGDGRSIVSNAGEDHHGGGGDHLHGGGIMPSKREGGYTPRGYTSSYGGDHHLINGYTTSSYHPNATSTGNNNHLL